MLLTRVPRAAQVKALGQIALESNLRPLVVVDDNSSLHGSMFGINLIQVPDAQARDAGYVNLNPIIPKESRVSAWEKALFLLCQGEKDFSHAWIIEDDVLVTTCDALARIDEDLPRVDLVVPPLQVNWNGIRDSTWPWWHHIPSDLLPPPWAKSMVCAVRLSVRLLDCVSELISFREREQRREGILFIENLFPTLAIHNGLTVASPRQLNGIVYRRAWSLSDFQAGFLYHPVKDWSVQVQAMTACGTARNFGGCL